MLVSPACTRDERVDAQLRHDKYAPLPPLSKTATKSKTGAAANDDDDSDSDAPGAAGRRGADDDDDEKDGDARDYNYLLSMPLASVACAFVVLV
jgi:hypothetical protein